MAVLFNETKSTDKRAEDAADIAKYNPYHGSDGRFTTSSSASSTSVAESKPKSFYELDRMAKQVGFSQGISRNVGLSVSNRCTESVLTGFGYVADEFPEIKKHLSVVDTNRFGVLCTDGSSLYINPEQVGSVEIFGATLERARSKSFWPQNATFETVGAHEAGHCVEMAIIEAKEKPGQATIKAWNDCKYAKKIVKQACRNVRTTPYGKGKRNRDLMVGISGQAGHLDHSEAFADAFADLQTNRKKANPLSKEIVRLAREELNSARKE